MPYEFRIVCDSRDGNPLTKERCYSDAQAKKPAPTALESTSRLASHVVKLKAKRKGWVNLKRPMRLEVWLCPVCVQVSRYRDIEKQKAESARIVARG